MLLRIITAITLALFLHDNCYAQGLEGIVVERYYLSDAADETDALDNGAVTPLPVGSITYRVYVDMADGYKFSQIFGTSIHPMTVNSTADFFNDPNYGVMINPGSISANNIRKHTAMIDSWFTTGGVSNSKVGVMKSEDPDGTVGNQHNVLANNAGGCYGLPINGANGQDGMMPSSPSTYLVPNSLGLGSALAALDQTSGNSIIIDNGAIAALGGIVGPTSSNRVLIAQFTTIGDLTFALNVQLVNIASGDAENYVASDPGSGELTHPTLTRSSNVAPTISITNPTNNATVPIGDLTITANAQDNGMIQQVEFFVDGASQGIDATSPFTWTYNVAAGSHQVYAIVSDMDCSTATSATVNFNAANNNPPTITLSGPTSAITGTTVTYTATAADTDGSVASVEFFVNGNSIGIDNSSPYSMDYITVVGSGQMVTAVVTDNLGASTTSNTVTLNVVNNALPTVSITSPISTDIFLAPQVITITANANDTDGNITQVEFFVNDVSVGIDNTAPYSVDWISTVGVAEFYAIATDNFDASTTSAVVMITVADPNALPYEISTSIINCDELTVCVPLNVTVAQPVDNVLGYDISLSYDQNKVMPTENILVGNALVNPSDVSFTVNTTVPGVISFSLFFNGGAGPDAEFTGFGNLCCVEFIRLDTFNPTDTTNIDIVSVQESYISGVELVTGTGGSVISEVDPTYEGNVLYWFNLTPLSYDVQAPDDYEPTTIQGIENGVVVNVANPSYPDLDGHFSHDLMNGDSLYLNRDIDNSLSVQHLINGLDAHLLKSMLAYSEFVPTYAQIACMDVNLDGMVSAGDLSQMMLRATHAIGEYQQAWNYDDQGNSNGQPSKDWVFYSQTNTQFNPAYAPSSTFPIEDGIGYDVNHLPTVSFVLPSNVTDFTPDGSTCPDINTDNYIAVLLGDIDGSFVNYSDIIASNDSIIFDLANITTFEISGDYYIEIPVEIHSLINANKAQDFRFKYDTNKMTFQSVVFISPNLAGEAYYNSDTEYLSITSSVGSSLQSIPNFESNMSMRFLLTSPCNEILPTDFTQVETFIEGKPVHHLFTNPASLPSISVTSSEPYCSLSDITVEYPQTINGLDIIGYSWSSNSATTVAGNPADITLTSSGLEVITLAATATNGCVYTITEEIFLYEGPVASFTTSIVDETVTFTNTSTVSSSSINGQSWDFGDTNTSTAANPVHTYASADQYNVSLTVTTEDGCSATTTSMVDVIDGVLEYNPALELTCYPNPASDLLHIIASKSTDIVMTDVTGQIVWQTTAMSVGDHSIDVSHLSSGVYFLSSLNDNTQHKIKVVISRK